MVLCMVIARPNDYSMIRCLWMAVNFSSITAWQCIPVGVLYVYAQVSICFIYIYVCVCVCVCVFMHTCLYICIFFLPAHSSVSRYICIYIYAYICIYAYVCVYSMQVTKKPIGLAMNIFHQLSGLYGATGAGNLSSMNRERPCSKDSFKFVFTCFFSLKTS